MLAIAVLYLLPRYDFVSERYGSPFSAPLRFLSNAAGNAIADGGLPGRMATARAARTLSFLIWGLGAVGAFRRYRHRLPVAPREREPSICTPTAAGATGHDRSICRGSGRRAFSWSVALAA